MRCAVPSTLLAVVACILVSVPRCESLECYSCRSVRVGVGACAPKRQQVEVCIDTKVGLDPNKTVQGNGTQPSTTKSPLQQGLDKDLQDALLALKNKTKTRGNSRSFSLMQNVKIDSSDKLRHDLMEGHHGQVEDPEDDLGSIQEDWEQTGLEDWERKQKEEEDRVEEKEERNETLEESPSVSEQHTLSKRSLKSDDNLLSGLPVDDQWCGSFKSAKDGYRRGCGVHLAGVVFEAGCHKMEDDYEEVTYCRCDGDRCKLDGTSGAGTRRGCKVVTWGVTLLTVAWWWVVVD